MPLLSYSFIEKCPSLSMAFELSLSALSFCAQLEKDRHFVVANQLLKSATSIGANISEAQDAESRADFIHKMKIAIKECGETSYWLLLCQRSFQYEKTDLLIELNNQLYKVLSKIISTAKKNLNYTAQKKP